MNKQFVIVATMAGMSPLANAQDKPLEAVPPESVVTLEKFSVVGRGETRATSTLTHVDLDATVPGLNPLLPLRSLPGIFVQTNDDIGLYEFGQSVRLRGFDSSQISFDVDGVPMGRNDPRGNPVGRFMDTEMLDSITLSQGSGDVSTPAYSALGGAIHYFTSGPLAAPGAALNVTFGSRQLLRSFVRADTGEFAGGFAGFVSYSHTGSNVSIGPGDFWRDHVESKIEKTFGLLKITGSYRYNNRFDHDVFSIDKASWEAGNYNVLFEGFTGDPATDTANFERWINARRDSLVNFNIESQITPDLKLLFVLYYQNQRGRGTAWEDSESAGFTSLPYQLIGREEIQKSNRRGLTGRVEYNLTLGNIVNTLAAGFWAEHEGYSRVRIEYPLAGPGSALAGQYSTTNRPPPELDLTRPLGYIYYHDIKNKVLQFYAEDKAKLMDNKLTLSGGIKALEVYRRFRGFPNKTYFNEVNVFAYRHKTFVNYFSPQLGATFDLTSTEQIFASFAHNYSVPGFNYFTNGNYDPSTKSETANNFDFGVRTSRKYFDASLTGYFISYHNRLLDVTPPAGSDVSTRGLVGQPVLQNVGNVRTKGLEAAISWKPARGFSLNASVTYTDSKFQNNYFNGTDLIQVKGKRTPEVPVLAIQSSADYNFGNGFGVGLSEQTQTKRYGTYLNDESIPGYTVCSAHAEYKFREKLGPLKNLYARFNVNNLFNKKYLGQVDGISVSGPNFYYPGAPVSYYATIGGAF